MPKSPLLVQTWLLGSRAAQAFSTALVLLAVISGLNYTAIRQFITANQWVTYTYQIREQLEQLLIQITDAETGQRGYLLTGDEHYLQLYQTASQQVRPTLQKLQQLTIHEKLQQERLTELTRLSEANLNALQHTIDVRRQQGLAAAVQSVQADQDERSMHSMRTLILTMQQSENNLLITRLDTGLSNARTALWVSGTGIVLAIALTGLALVVINRDMAARNHAEVERALALEREHIARLRSEKIADQLHRLQAVTAAFSEALTPERVTQVVVEQGVQTLGASAGSVVQLSEDRQHLAVVASIGYSAAVLESYRLISMSMKAPLTDAARAGKAIWIETVDDWAQYPEFVDSNSRVRNISVVALPLHLEGRLLGAIGLSFDALRTFSDDDRAFMEALAQHCAQAFERAQLYQREQEAVRIRDVFLSVAAHELRTPLTALLGYSTMVQQRVQRTGSVEERDLRALNIMTQQVKRLNELVNLLLDTSQIQTGMLVLQRQTLDLDELITEVVDEISTTLEMHRIVYQRASAALVVDGDSHRLRQVLHNLLSNAIKYSPAGGVIEIQVEHQRDNVRISVCDHGIGVPAHALPHLFNRFYRAPNANPQQISGLGVGLYVVNDIVAQHGGTIEVTSNEGVGSTFTVCIPTPSSEPRPRDQAAHSPHSTKQV